MNDDTPEYRQEKNLNEEIKASVEQWINTPIKMFHGRPEREKIIGLDDLDRLKIMLNASQTIEEFLEKI
jgi:hypothetical protein